MKRITSQALLDALVAKNMRDFDRELADLLAEHERETDV